MGDVIVTNKDSEYKWKMNRLMNDSPSSPNFPPDAICIPSGSAVDCLSQVQSDMINIDDSVSQVADRVANREREQVAKTMTIITPNNSLLPKTLLEIGSQVSQNTDALLGINPESIVIQTGIDSMVGPGSIISIHSILTDDLANEYQRLQTQLNFHRKVAGVELKEFDEVSIVSDMNSIRTDMIHKEFMDILAQRTCTDGDEERPESRPASTSQASSRGGSSRGASSRGTFTSESSKQSTVKSRTSERSRRSTSVKRVYDTKLEEEKLKAELNLLYVEKQEAEQELVAIRDEITQKESIANNSSLASSARLEALEIGSKLENTKQELFRERRDHRSIIEELQASLEHVTKKYEDLTERRSCTSDSRSEILLTTAQNSTITCLEEQLAEAETELENYKSALNINTTTIKKLEMKLKSYSTPTVLESNTMVQKILLEKKTIWMLDHEKVITKLHQQLSTARKHNEESHASFEQKQKVLRTELRTIKETHNQAETQHEKYIAKMRKEQEYSISTVKAELDTKKLEYEGVISKLNVELETRTRSLKRLEKEKTQNTTERVTLIKIRKQILRVCPTMSVKEIDSVDSALRILETVLTKSNTEENQQLCKEELMRKDEELRKIEKNMTSWKQATAKRLAQKFEIELKKLSERATLLTITDSESGFESSRGLN